MKEYSREWVKIVRERKKIAYQRYVRGEDIKHISSLVNTGKVMIKRDNDSHSSHSRNNSNNSMKRNNSHNSLSESMDEECKSMKSSPNCPDPTYDSNNDSPDMVKMISSSPNRNRHRNRNHNHNNHNSKIVTNEERVRSSKEYLKLTEKCRELALQKQMMKMH